MHRAEKDQVGNVGLFSSGGDGPVPLASLGGADAQVPADATSLGKAARLAQQVQLPVRFDAAAWISPDIDVDP